MFLHKNCTFRKSISDRENDDFILKILYVVGLCLSDYICSKTGTFRGRWDQLPKKNTLKDAGC